MVVGAGGKTARRALRIMRADRGDAGVPDAAAKSRSPGVPARQSGRRRRLVLGQSGEGGGLRLLVCIAEPGAETSRAAEIGAAVFRLRVEHQGQEHVVEQEGAL